MRLASVNPGHAPQPPEVVGGALGDINNLCAHLRGQVADTGAQRLVQLLLGGASVNLVTDFDRVRLC